MAVGAMKDSSNSRSKSYLCREIVLAILSRLPTKPLFRFKCTSKSWLSLIDQNLARSRALPSTLPCLFYHAFNKNFSINRPIFIEHVFIFIEHVFDHNHHYANDYNNIDTVFGFLCTKTMILDSCNGLLLCRNSDKAGGIYYVCNPATKRYALLPYLPDKSFGNKSPRLARLAYDPYVCPSDYKVILFMYSEIRIYSSENPSDGWATIDISSNPIDIDSMDSFRCQGGAFSNGALYMVNDISIIRYRLRQQQHHTIRFPNCYPDSIPFIGILGGSICCASLDSSHLRIWTLMEKQHSSSASWRLKHDSDLKEHLDDVSGHILAFHPFSEVIVIESPHLRVWGYYVKKQKKLNISGRGIEQGTRTIRTYGANIFPYTPCYTSAPKEWTGNTTRNSVKGWLLQELGIEHKGNMQGMSRAVTFRENDNSSLEEYIELLTKELYKAKRQKAERDKQIAEIKLEIISSTHVRIKTPLKQMTLLPTVTRALPEITREPATTARGSSHSCRGPNSQQQNDLS